MVNSRAKTLFISSCLYKTNLVFTNNFVVTQIIFIYFCICKIKLFGNRYTSNLFNTIIRISFVDTIYKRSDFLFRIFMLQFLNIALAKLHERFCLCFVLFFDFSESLPRIHYLLLFGKRRKRDFYVRYIPYTTILTSRAPANVFTMPGKFIPFQKKMKKVW